MLEVEVLVAARLEVVVGGQGLELCPGQLEGVGILALQLPGLAPLHPGQAAQGHHGPELLGQLQLDFRGQRSAISWASYCLEESSGARGQETGDRRQEGDYLRTVSGRLYS